MLGQLICLDRRYQRMNCFNIREVQSLLKRRFFADLVNTADHRTFLNETMLGVRFKTGDIGVTNSHFFLYSNFGLSLDHKIRYITIVSNETSALTPCLNANSYFLYFVHVLSSSFFPPLGFFPINFYLFNPAANQFPPFLFWDAYANALLFIFYIAHSFANPFKNTVY